MQNIDFYSGKTARDLPPQFNRADPEYFARLAKVQSREDEKSMKRATRMLFLIAALCIISFTTGLVIGIKFVSGSKKEIVDEQTRRAVDDIGKKVAGIIKDTTTTDLNAAPVSEKLFAREQFPYTIQIPGDFSRPESREIANSLSSKGQTVIIAKNNGKFRIYLGPYRDNEEAENSLKEIKGFSNEGYLSEAVIVRR